MKSRILVLMHPAGKVAYIKLGFSWPAFFFGPLWAIVKRLWLHFAAMMAVGLAMKGLDVIAQQAGSLLLVLSSLTVSIIFMWVCGRYGNFWLRDTLLKRGYRPIDSDV